MLKALLTAACLARALGFAPSRAARFAAPARPAARAAVSMEMGMFEIVAPAIGTAVYAVGFNLLKDDEPAEAIDDKKEVEAYFNDATEGGGFDRWNRIYSESDDVNKVQLEIRSGHQQTIDKVLEWVDADKAAGAALSGTVPRVTTRPLGRAGRACTRCRSPGQASRPLSTSLE